MSALARGYWRFGGLRGTTGADGVEAGPVPMAFVAVTVKVWAVPGSKPVTVQCSGPDIHVQVWPPGRDVTA